MSKATELFEAELRRRGLQFQHGKEPNLYVVTVAGEPITVSLDNAARNFERDHDPNGVVHFVEGVLAAAGPSPLPWNPELVFWSVEQPARGATGVVVEPVRKSKKLVRVLVLTDAAHSRLRFVTDQHLTQWKVSKADAAQHANRNLSKLLVGKAPEINSVRGAKLAMLPLQEPFKASAVFAPAFKEFIAKPLGWPVMAVLPCRDFVFVVQEHSEELLGAMGDVVQREFRRSGYPLSTEVFRIDDDGPVAVGAFPE